MIECNGFNYIDCMTKSEIHALQPTTKDMDGECKRKLYLTNKQILMNMMLGITSSHCLAVIQKMMSMDFLQETACMIEILKQSASQVM